MRLDVFRTEAPVPYREALQRQRTLHRQRVAGEIADTLWLLEHPPVFTTGIRRNQEKNLRGDPSRIGAEIVETERGGEITYHGPGQLVGYLLVGIDNHGYRVKDFVKKIEDGFVDYLKTAWNLPAQRDPAFTGVWIGRKKITAIGIALRSRVTLHGFAFNVNTELSHFDFIVPCGISRSDRGVTSLEKTLGKEADLPAVAEALAAALGESLGYGMINYRVEDSDSAPCLGN